MLGELLAQGQGEELVRVACALLLQMHDHARRLEVRVAQLLLHRYGRRSEQIDPGQLVLLLQEIVKTVRPAAPEPASPPAPSQATSQTPVRSKPTGRRPLPADLPRERVVYTPPQLGCPCCGRERVKIGEETSEVLDWSPATFRVLVHVREKYACGRCKEGVEIAPAPDKVIDGGLPGAGLVAQVVVAKFRDHLPLERQATGARAWSCRPRPWATG
jgi:transposase